jgi:multicomponent Na+:H+ antiporter subunit D
MVAGVGMGTALALDGAAAHAYSHILYKSLLFMGTGAVLYQTGGLRKLTELGGIASRMKLVVVLYMIGAFSISGFPLWNGFISKSMVISAAAESHRPLVELLLTLASVGTFLHTGLKLPYFTFFGKPSGRKDLSLRPLPSNMLVAMGLGAALCTLYGVVPSLLYRLLPMGSDYHPYTLDHVVSTTQLLLGTAVAFYLLLAKLGGEATVSLDVDWLYRRPLARLVDGVVGAAAATGAALQAAGEGVASASWRLVRSPMGPVDLSHDPRSTDYDPYRFRFPIGVTLFWVVVYFVVIATVALLRVSSR